MRCMVAGEAGETNKAILSGMHGMMVGDLITRIGITRWISRQGNATTDFSLIGLHVDLDRSIIRKAPTGPNS